jgi:GNAT superfamily N-acetyltransferase
MAEVEIRVLQPGDDRSGFVSGDPDLDRFFQKYAGQNQFRHHVGTTYVAVAGGTIIGFATVSAASIHVDAVPEKQRRRLPHYPLPVLRLARLAVDQRMRQQGVGQQLLRATLSLAREMADRIGCVGVLVDAKPGVVEYYRQYGFEELEVIEGALGDRPPPIPMFLPLAAIPDPESNDNTQGI